MNDYQLLLVHNEKQKELIREAQQVRAANAAQRRQESVKKNNLVHLLTSVGRR